MATATRKRILLLEDEMLIAMELEATVEDRECMVVGPVASCSAALKLLDVQQVDAAILDFVINDGRCDSVADELDRRGIPWALSTGMDVAILGHRYQAVPLIAKPFTASQIDMVLDRLLVPQSWPTSSINPDMSAF